MLPRPRSPYRGDASRWRIWQHPPTGVATLGGVLAGEYDVAIIGGGPAGSAMASYLAQAGVSCAVFEQEVFPRPHVGESLVPSSERIFNEMGFLDEMQDADFPRKYGAAWTRAGGARG